MKEQRELTFDMLRVAAMLMVIAIHVLGNVTTVMQPYNFAWYVWYIGSAILMVCNPLFFMISGDFNTKDSMLLEIKTEEEKNVRNILCFWYYKKFANIIIPFVTCAFLTYSIQCVLADTQINLTYFGMALLGNNILGVYWYMVAYITMIAFAPAFSAMINNMNKGEVKIFLTIAVLGNIFITITTMFKIQNAFSWYIIFCNWYIFYFIGASIEKLNFNHILDKSFKFRILLEGGAVAAIITAIILLRFFPQYGYAYTDTCPTLILTTLGVYTFLSRLPIKHRLGNIVLFFSKHSFTIYLVHYIFLQRIELFVLRFSVFSYEPTGVFFILKLVTTYIVTLIISTMVAVILNNFIFKPIQRITIHKMKAVLIGDKNA